MPEIDYAPEHKIQTESEFDRLKLKKDEKARIACLEKPTFAWVHTLRAPKIVNGAAVKMLKERKDKSTYTDYDMEYIGRPLCLGDYGIIKDKGLDAANCPICERAKGGSDQVAPPERRFAMNVISYRLKGDGSLVTPFSCSCVVWGFTDKIYGRLVDIVTEFGSLTDHDLMLTCINETFQNFEITPAMKAVWQLDERVKEVVQATFAENRVVDLERACGRRAEKRWIELDLEKVAERWAVVNGVAPPDEWAVGADKANLSEGLDALLDAAAPVKEAAKESAEEPAAAPAPSAATTPPPAPEEGFDFDTILKGLEVS